MEDIKTRFKHVDLFAQVWFKNGDHVLDYINPCYCPISGETYSPEHQKECDWEGQFVRRYRHPDFTGTVECSACGHTLHEHGHIEPHCVTVCPGDVIVRTEDNALILALKPAVASAILTKEFS